VGGDHHDAAGCGEVAQYGVDLDVGEARRGLIAEQKRRVVGQCPCDGDALLLPAGQVAGPVAGAIGEAERLEQRFAPGRGPAAQLRPRPAAAPPRSPGRVRLGTRLNASKTIPTVCRRQSRSTCPRRPVTSTPFRWIAPEVGVRTAASADRALSSRTRSPPAATRAQSFEGPLFLSGAPAGSSSKSSPSGATGT
jgi:hypothetical protein